MNIPCTIEHQEQSNCDHISEAQQMMVSQYSQFMEMEMVRCEFFFPFRFIANETFLLET